MIKVALVNPNGEVGAVFSPATDDMYKHLETYGDQLAVHILPTANDSDVLHNWYWDGDWKARDPRPNRWSVWKDNEWVIGEVDVLAAVRTKRNQLLSDCDWTQTIDAPVSVAKQAEWRDYRKELRDLTNNLDGIATPDDVVYPEAPL